MEVFKMDFGNILTILIMVGGFFLHYIAIYSKIIERIVRLEEKYEGHKENTGERIGEMKKDIDLLFEQRRKGCDV